VRSLLHAAAGARSRHVVLAASLVVLLGLSSLAGRLGEVTSNATVDSLPAGSESRAVIKARAGFATESVLPAVVVYRRDSGLTAADRATIAADKAKLQRAGLELAGGVAGPRLSEDGTSAVLVVPLVDPDDPLAISEAVKEMRAALEGAPPGLQVKVTGAAGFTADIADVFAGLDVKLLLFTALLVLVLLIAIYRSPVFWTIPFVTVVLAEGATRGVAYLIGSAGMTVSDQTSGIVSVLVFGAGTDYALLLVSRYRDELHRHEDKRQAMRIALDTGGPAILASGCTVSLALLALLAADVGSTRALGPLGAAGVSIAMLASLTLLPSLLLVAGRRAFWPFVPRVEEADDPATRGVFRGVGERVSRRPRTVWIATALALAVAALGIGALETTQTQNGEFIEKVEAVEGQELLAKSFPAGSSEATTIYLPGADSAEALAVGRRLAAETELVEGVAGVLTGPSGALLQVTLTEDPFSPEAAAQIPPLREAVRALAGEDALVGGETAQTHDLNAAAERDNGVVPPLVLLIVFAVLVALLRAVTGSLILIATVVLSFLATLGIAALLFEHVFGFEDASPSIPLLGFVFLVALGIDYNIFLMARVREEARSVGTREGMLRGLAATGSVITSAGIVLAGTFTLLGVLPLVTLAQLGFIVAFGVVLDSFLVRSILVPAVVFDVDRRFWWPSALARRGGKPPTRLTDVSHDPNAARRTVGM
jgi:RND superfamily putative drug exporter